MYISSLDITLRRIQDIEYKFNILNNAAGMDDENEFQSLLDSKISQKKEIKNPPILNTQFADRIYSSTPAEPFSRGDIDNLIEAYAAKNDLDSAFVKAVIKQESGFQPEVMSHCGAMGLMQLMPETASSMGVMNAFNPEENIMGGTKYLKGLLDRFGGNKALALAAYNAGPGAVQRYGGIPPYEETQNYVKSVLAHYEKFKSGGQD